MKRLLLIICFIMLSMMYVKAEAATQIVYSGDYAIGINDLQVSSLGNYDVTFTFGTATDLFNATGSNVGDWDFPGAVTVGADALMAAQAIRDTLNAPDPNVQIINNTYTEYYIPFYRSSAGNDNIGAWDGTWSDNQWNVDPASSATISRYDQCLYAKFTPVPIPGAVWLFGSGLIGIVSVRRKINK